MECVNCSGLKDKAHYHIIVEEGCVTTMWYVSADGFWDRELTQDEFFVEYKSVA